MTGGLSGGERAVDVGVDEWDGEGSFGRGRSREEDEVDDEGTAVGDDDVRCSTGEAPPAVTPFERPAREDDAGVDVEAMRRRIGVRVVWQRAKEERAVRDGSSLGLLPGKLTPPQQYTHTHRNALSMLQRQIYSR